MSFYIKRRDRIILTTVEIIDELGFQGLSIKEICKRQEISEGALYKHFASKSEVILGVLDLYAKFDIDIQQTIQINSFSPKESIAYLFRMNAEYYESYPQMTAILNYYEFLRHERGIAPRITEIFESRLHFLEELIREGIKMEEIHESFDSEIFSEVLMGTTHAIIQKWRIRNYNFSLKARLLSTLDQIMKSCDRKNGVT